MHDVFSNWCCRAVLYALRDGPESMPDVVEQVRAWQRNATRWTDRTTSGTERMTPAAIRTQVLELVEFGVLEFDPADDTVRIAADVSISVTVPSGCSERKYEGLAD